MSCICVKGAETLEGRFVLDRMESKSVATTVVVLHSSHMILNIGIRAVCQLAVTAEL